MNEAINDQYTRRRLILNFFTRWNTGRIFFGDGQKTMGAILSLTFITGHVQSVSHYIQSFSVLNNKFSVISLLYRNHSENNFVMSF